ncbi:UvrD-helicase domain-containing protein [Hydrogenovibrio sp. 3SP14C1]|uniref:UvrD-helicase domain-containing protein n=1 Tax=Hydrogenovibrio sp. 3SP14C1 TaxID=3038774 RepID=UPI002416D093|nr:UvrD-helicase domain-containing protein [Hydrogenovibrio sp. 3SP14C1]MDG4812263.1 UvrD-helicase domain-containing protein [Hydrogenovibrio sp. 3SP14C1]
MNLDLDFGTDDASSKEKAIDPLKHLILDEALPDGNARFQAIHPQHSFIVQAPAGSGKTALLTQRFLALLSQVETPEQVVAMTFTKKAAAEMRERILEALQFGLTELDGDSSIYDQNTWHLAQAALQNNQQRQWHLLDNPNRLRIRTIDSMNGYLVQQMPLLSRLGAQPQVASMNDALYLKAVRLALKDADTTEASASLLRLVNGNYRSAENLLVTMLKKRDQWMGGLLAYGKEAEAQERIELEKALALLVTQEKTQAIETLYPVMPLLQQIAEFAGFAMPNEQPQLKPLVDSALTEESALSAWQALGSWILSAKGEFLKTVTVKKGFPAGKGENKEQKDAFVALLAELNVADVRGQYAQALVVLSQLPDGSYSDEQWQNLRHLIQLLRRTVAHLKLCFQTEGEADFIEVAQAASQALGHELEPTDLAQQLDYTLKHLLIDEFQDTSVAQYDLVKKLVAGWSSEDSHSLFIVGDPMQSIYRFREAEVGNFLQAWQGRLGEVPLTPLSLDVNFRSSKGVVDWVNQTFAKVFPKKSLIEQGAVSYAPAVAFSKEESPAVYPHWALEQSASDEASRILDLIQERLPDLKAGDSIGILGRSRSHLMGVATQLKQSGIAFRAVELEGLKDRQEIQDCEALTRALLHLGDRPAWIALLRSPLVGLSLTDLYRLLGENEDYFQTPVWETLQDKNHPGWQQLSDAGHRQLESAYPVLEKALNAMGSYALEVLLRETWLALDGPQTVESAVALQNVDAFWMMLSSLEAQNDVSALTAKGLSDTLEALYALPDASEASQKVELMTMHKSKGLEFDTVILPGLGRQPRSDEKQLLSWLSFKGQNEYSYLVIAPFEQKGKVAQKQPGLASLIKRYEEIKQSYELARLLYVACTRAKQQLHLFGSVSVSEKAFNGDVALTPKKKSLLECLWPIEKPKFEVLLREYQFIEAEENSQVFLPKISRLPLERTGFWQTQIVESDLVKTARTTAVTEDDMVESFDAFVEASQAEQASSLEGGILAKTVGNFVHAVFEQWGQQDLSGWDDTKLETQRARYQYGLMQMGLNRELLKTALERVMVSLSHALHNPKVRWALSREHAESAVELPLSAKEETGQSNHIIDRTFVDEQNTRWIIDYKTSVFDLDKPEQDKKAFLQSQIDVYTPQLERYGQLLGVIENRPQKRVLYFSYLDEWIELD